MRIKRYTFAAVLLSSTALACSAFAQAPSAPAAQTGDTIAEVVVTARRVEENVQTIPVAVSALSGETLARAQIANAPALQGSAPGLVIASGAPGTSGFAFVSIRGQGNVNAGVANDPAIGIYLDGVYVPRPSQGVTQLADLQRIEVLRGPQGTLFGRNTTGGAISVSTNDPVFHHEAQIWGQRGTHGTWDLGGLVNVPLANGLAARLVYDHREHGSYIHNASLGMGEADLTSDYVAGKLRYAPDDSPVSVVLAGDYNRLVDHGQATTLGAIDPNATAINLTLGGLIDLSPIWRQMAQFLQTKNNFYTTYGTGFDRNSAPPFNQARPFDRVQAYGASATVNVDLPGGQTLKSISGFRYSNAAGLNDIDSTPVSLLPNQSGFISRQYSEELQLTGDIGKKFKYITGLYYSHETGREYSYFQALGFLPDLLASAFGLPPGALGPAAVPLNNGDVMNQSIGAFAQGYYNFTDRLRMTAGLRWTWDKRDVVLKNLGDVALGNCVNQFNDVAGICALSRSASFNYPAYTFGFDYQATDDLFVYVKTSRASKSGGWNLRQGSEATPAFRPETVKDAEVGAKYEAPNHRFRLNAAAFYSWSKDVQRSGSAFIDGKSTQYILNAGRTHVYGVELESIVIPIEHLELSANLSLMDGHYVKGTFHSELAPGVLLDRSGEPLTQTPKVQYAVAGTYTIPTQSGDLVLHLDYSYVSAQHSGSETVNPFAPPALQAQQALQNTFNRYPGYGLLNGTITFDVGKSGWQIQAFGRNMLNKKYLTNTFANLYDALGFAENFVGDPSVFGVGAKYRWGGGR